MTDLLINYIQFCAGIVLLVFAIIQLVYRNKSIINYVLSGLFFCISFTILYLWLFQSGLISHFRYLLYHDITITMLIGPFVFFYLRAILGITSPPRKVVILNLIPSGIAFFVVTSVNICHPSLSIHYIDSKVYLPDYTLDSTIWWWDKIANTDMVIYFAISFLVIFKFFRIKTVKPAYELKFLLAYMFFVLSSAVVLFISSLINNNIMTAASVTVLSLLGVFYFIVSFRFPGFMHKAIREARSIRVKKMIAEHDSAEVIVEMESLMHDKKLFTDENLSLQKMSDFLGVTSHQLSRIINETTGTNFRVYLNSYRVREAMVMLREKPELSVIEVAFAIGFNSKSSFNDAFLKSVGITPRDYRIGCDKK